MHVQKLLAVFATSIYASSLIINRYHLHLVVKADPRVLHQFDFISKFTTNIQYGYSLKIIPAHVFLHIDFISSDKL